MTSRLRGSALGLLILSLFSPQPAVGCRCGAEYTPCSALASTSVLFVGYVLRDSGPDPGSGPALVRVDEVLRGLPNEISEVEIDSGFWTSCYRRLREGQRYVLFAWRDSDGPVELHTGLCSETFELDGNEHVLSALRNSLLQGLPRVVGTVSGKRAGYSPREGISHAAIVLSRDNYLKEETASSSGAFEFINPVPGTYRLSASQAEYKSDAGRSLTVPETGCVWIEPRLSWIGRISGTIRSRLGETLPNVLLEAFSVDPSDGTIGVVPIRSARTSADGKYTIRDLPPGEYILGVNVRKMHGENPFPPTVYPEGSDLRKANRIRVEGPPDPVEVNLTLPRPNQSAALQIQVVLDDGLPASAVEVRVANTEDAGTEQVSATTDSDGRAEFRLEPAQKYTVEAIFYDAVSGLKFEGRSDPVLVDGRNRVVQLRLRQRSLIDP